VHRGLPQPHASAAGLRRHRHPAVSTCNPHSKHRLLSASGSQELSVVTLYGRQERDRGVRGGGHEPHAGAAELRRHRLAACLHRQAPAGAPHALVHLTELCHDVACLCQFTHLPMACCMPAPESACWHRACTSHRIIMKPRSHAFSHPHTSLHDLSRSVCKLTQAKSDMWAVLKMQTIHLPW